MKPGNGAGLAPGSTLASKRAGKGRLAVSIIVRLGVDSHLSLNITDDKHTAGAQQPARKTQDRGPRQAAPAAGRR
jgi:hypothetical protein